MQILASDGLWDVLQPDEAVQMAMEARRKGQTATQVRAPPAPSFLAKRWPWGAGQAPASNGRLSVAHVSRMENSARERRCVCCAASASPDPILACFALQVAHTLVEKAVDKGLEGSDEQDNTSAIVVFFNAGVQVPGGVGVAAAAGPPSATGAPSGPCSTGVASGPGSARHSGSGTATPPGTLPQLACASPGTPGSANGSAHE